MSKVVIFGGHGKVALRAIPLLAAAGHEVGAVVRNPDHSAEISHAGATPIVADVEHLDVEEIARVVDGYDVVVWSAGAGGGSPERTFAVDRDAAIRSIDASIQAGVPRYIIVSYFGAGPDHGVAEDNSFYAYAEAKAAADVHLRSTSLDWTVLGPSSLTDDAGAGAITTKEQGANGDSVSRDDVAAVIAATVDEPATVGRTVEFDGGTTPISDALR